jgi:hypothetical protein
VSRRSSITCVFPTGECFYCSLRDAEKIVADGEGEWDGAHTLRMNHHDRTGGRLSLIVGRHLAESSRRNEGWARVAVSEVLGRD